MLVSKQYAIVGQLSETETPRRNLGALCAYLLTKGDAAV
jgi:hypothetical protein